MTRGIKHDVDRFVNDMQAQYFPYGKTGIWAQLSMRPIQLWEIVFPEEQLPVLVKTIGCDAEVTPGMSKYLALLRKPLKAKKLPKMDLKDTPWRPLYKENVAMYPIGIKEDKRWTQELIDSAVKKGQNFPVGEAQKMLGEEML